MKLFQREQRSLFGEILDWMLTPLLLLWPVTLALTWLVAQALADKPFDRALEHQVQALAQWVRWDAQGQAHLALPLPEAMTLPLPAQEGDTVYYQVRGPGGVHLAGDAALQAPEGEAAVVGRVVLRDAVLQGQDIRVAALWVVQPGAPQPGASQPGGPQSDTPQRALVQVAETREKRRVLAAEIIKGVMLPQFVSVPLSILLVWLALARGIKPLSRLEERIRARKPEDLSPLNLQAVPLEVVPMVDAVNDLMRRLHESLATQKRFLADAAHQLKTPLAGLRMQADLAQREGVSTEELKRSLEQIGRASMRATHTVNQLLSLARAEGAGASVPRAPCDLAQLAIEVVQDLLPLAMERHVDLGYEGAEPGAQGVWLHGNATLVQELVRNLLTNAINYSPSSAAQPAVVTVRVLALATGQRVQLQVEDTGPGVPLHERERVFQPFYRVLGSEADGSGLGLPIVQEIARLHGGSVSLADAQPLRQPPGALFTVQFPALRAGPLAADSAWPPSSVKKAEHEAVS